MADRRDDKWPPVYTVAFWFLTASLVVFCIITLNALDRMNTRLSKLNGIFTWQQGLDNQRHSDLIRRVEKLEGPREK
jgi:hypothetical protein